MYTHEMMARLESLSPSGRQTIHGGKIKMRRFNNDDTLCYPYGLVV